MSKNVEYSVSSYNNKESIIDCLKEHDSSFIDSLSSNNKHFNYLEQYLTKKNVKTIVFEFEYIDKDYIEDYSQYYSKCFQDYKKRCVRLHFFKKDFDKKDFDNILIRGSQADVNELQIGYVGFVVLRPIPLTIFGKTCLKTYPQNSDKPSKNRFFPIIRQYSVHLFGINLCVDSIAFQEQDNSVSACATSALWSAFHGTGILFHHHIPSPFEITLSATKLVTDYANRSFPNKGLLPSQMAHAVKELRLDPLLINFINMSYFKAHIYAYLKAGVPVIIGLKMKGYTDAKDTDGKEFGLHAVTTTGYNINSIQKIEVFKRENKGKTEESKNLYLSSSAIDTIYVHDDQLGPFAKMGIPDGHDLLETTWSDLDKEQFCKVLAKPTALLIPLHPKIRIHFDKIFNIINAFTTTELYSYRKDIIWDIHLSTISQLKKCFFENVLLTAKNKLDLLTKSFPKYIWVADGYLNDENNDKKIKFSFYFDATDVDNGNLFICSVHYDIIHYFTFKVIAAKNKAKDSQQIFSIKNIQNYYSQQILYNYLEDKKDITRKVYSPSKMTLNEIYSMFSK